MAYPLDRRILVHRDCNRKIESNFYNNITVEDCTQQPFQHKYN